MARDNTRAWYAMLTVIVFSMSSAGCITTRNFESIPVQAGDFQIPYEELSQKYPDIPLYQKKFRGFKPNTPLTKDLIALWGEPDEIKTDWWFLPGFGVELAILTPVFDLTAGQAATVAGIIILMTPSSPQTYIWIKGNYCIEAGVHLSFPNYRKSLRSWTWTPLHDEEKLNKACTAALRRSREGAPAK